MAMRAEWEEIFFEVTVFRDTQIPILVGSNIEEM